jgi:hypothetical protein
MQHRFSLTAIALAASIVLTACGGGGGGGSSSPPSGNTSVGTGSATPGTTAAPQSFAVAFDAKSRTELLAVDSENKLGAVTLAPAGKYSDVQTYYAGTYDSATMVATDVHPTFVTFFSEGKLFTASLSKSQTPQATQVSSESGATNICTVSHPVAQASAAGNAYLVYSLAGVDATCGGTDDEWKLVNLAMNASDAPTSLVKPLDDLIDPMTGNVSGWVTVEGTELLRRDANSANPQKIADVDPVNSFLAYSHVGNVPGGKVMIVDDTLQRYDVATNTLTPIAFTFEGVFAGSASDADSIYFSDLSFDATFKPVTKLYRTPADGSAAPQLVVTENDFVYQMQATNNKVVYEIRSSTGSRRLWSVNKLGGTPALISSLLNGESDWYTAGTYVYYTGKEFTGDIAKPYVDVATIVGESGGVQLNTTKAFWLASLLPSTLSLKTDYLPIAKLIEVDLRTLKSYDAATAQLVATSGTVPTAGISTMVAPSSQVGNNFFSVASNGTGTTSDLFFADSVTNNSLKRLTNHIQ